MIINMVKVSFMEGLYISEHLRTIMKGHAGFCLLRNEHHQDLRNDAEREKERETIFGSRRSEVRLPQPAETGLRETDLWLGPADEQRERASTARPRRLVATRIQQRAQSCSWRLQTNLPSCCKTGTGHV